MTYRQVVKILRKNGWVFVRSSDGSHVQYKKAGCAYLASIPDHGSKDLSIGVIKSLENGTGLSLRKR